MLYRRLLPSVALLLAVALPLVGQDKDKDKGKDDQPKVTLAWKFKVDEPFYQTMTTETEQTMKVMGNEVKQTQKQTFYFSWTPRKQTGDSWELVQKIVGVKMDIDIGGSRINYDSTQENQAQNALGGFFKALVGSEFTVTLDTKAMKVTKVEGGKEFIKKLGDARPEMKTLLEQILSDAALKEMAEPTFAVLPTKAVAKGDTWERTSTLDMGPIGKYENKYTYTYEGKEGGNDKIAVKTDLKYTPPGEENKGVGGLPFKIKSAQLESTDAKGTILFDRAKGRVVKSDQSLDLKGQLNIEIGGSPTMVDLSQTQKTTVETSDENPVKKSSSSS
jgi:hypothetical protein